jgi:hypothetical protein
MARHVLVTLREAALNAVVACVRCGLEGFEAYTFSTATHVLHSASLLPTEHCAAVGTLVILHHSVRRMLARVSALEARQCSRSRIPATGVRSDNQQAHGGERKDHGRRREHSDIGMDLPVAHPPSSLAG